VFVAEIAQQLHLRMEVAPVGRSGDEAAASAAGS
jgi:hypothetical protein